jgi:hypothetical protein
MTNKSVVAATIFLCVFLAPEIHGRNNVSSLVVNLLEIGYPISAEEVLALDKIAMRFDGLNRLDVLRKILSDRDRIHGMKGADYLAKTDAVGYALRLLDEHSLPETDALIEALSRQAGWERREKTRLSYMAAKRGIDYASNVASLLGELSQSDGGPDTGTGVDITVGILDFSNTLSYLSDVFNHTGDVDIGAALIRYVARAYGYPAEYASRLLVDMCIHQPVVFVPLLAAKDEETKKTIIDAIVFGIWNNQQKENVLEAIGEALHLRNKRERDMISLLRKKIKHRFAYRSSTGKDSKIDQNPKK